MTLFEVSTQVWLEAFIAKHGGIAGTVHALHAGDRVLRLVASKNIPEPVLRATATIPKGKGMAGLAWERGRPVDTCNLQTDQTGDVRPGAKAVDAQAAVALPVFGRDAQLRAVVGVAFGGSRTFEDDALRALMSAAQSVPESVPERGGSAAP